MYINRSIENNLEQSIENFPVSAVLGARQTGKTTLVKKIISRIDNAIYLDLERPSDRNKLADSELFFAANSNHLICLDEIQLMPELFAVIRSMVDDKTLNLKFLITGSASPGLLRQSSETLAGRIAFLFLSGSLFTEVEPYVNLNEYWLRGGFPKSLLAKNDEISYQWRENFMITFLERDLRNFGFNIAPATLRRFWQMLAHINGQIINYSILANSIAHSDTSVRKYVDILTDTYMVRVLYPYFTNVKKRLVKRPKIYFRDTGILHALLGIREFNDLLAHPVLGASWEAMCIENILNIYNKWEPYFYRTSAGAEIDLLLVKSTRKIAIEFKVSKSPKVSRGFWNAINDLQVDKAYVIAPVEQAYPFKENVWVYPLSVFLKLKEL